MSQVIQLLNSILFSFGKIKPLTGPSKICIEPTHRCNSRCKTCNFWQKKNFDDELTTKEFLKIIADLYKIGARRIAFVGGEPLLRKDIFELVKRVNKYGMTISIGTNGLLLKEKCEDIINSKVDIIEVSIDGATAEVHDRNRGINGAFNKTIAGVKEILKFNNRPIVQFNITPNDENILDLVNVAKLTKGIGVDCLSIEPAHPLNENLNLSEELFVKEDKLAAFEKEIEELLNNYSDILVPPLDYYKYMKYFFENPKKPDKLPKMRCCAGYHLLIIDPKGDVYSCPAKEVKIGNLKENSLFEIWHSKKLINDIKRIKNGNHKMCWLNSTAPLNIALNYINQPRNWLELYSLIKSEKKKRF